MASPPAFESPRVLLVLPDQWPRALLRAELREEGYDAVGARSLEEALVYRPEVPERGPVRLVLVEGDAVGEGALAGLLARHGNPPAVLLAHAAQEIPAGPWVRVIRRPVSIADLARVVRELVPLRDGPARPLDR
jgi:CheY-like chemotaxis protein